MKTNKELIISRINELYDNGLVDEFTPISTVLETVIEELYEQNTR